MDHVINHGFTMKDAGRRVQSNVNRSTVSSIVQTFRRKTGIYFLVLQYVKHFYEQQYCKGKCKSICTFYRTTQQPGAGGRAAVFNHQQEREICNMIIANNSIRLREIQSAIINFPRCTAMENIRCDVDENLWPDQQERQDDHQESFFSWMLFCIFVYLW